MYTKLFNSFENAENLGGKAWEHAVTLDFLNTTKIKDCSIHCFHYQQIFEYFFKHILETRSQFGSYSKSHKLNNLLEEVVGQTDFRTDKSKYYAHLVAITICAEEYRYNFDIDCKVYFNVVLGCDELLIELIEFEKK